MALAARENLGELKSTPRVTKRGKPEPYQGYRRKQDKGSVFVPSLPASEIITYREHRYDTGLVVRSRSSSEQRRPPHRNIY